MNTTLRKFDDARLPLEAVLDAVPADRWTEPSPCEGWTTRDVLRHIIETQRDFFVGRGVDVAAGPDLEADPASAWNHHAQWVGGALEDDAFVTSEYEGFFGPTTVGETFAQFYVWDMLVHRWDIATAARLDAKLTDGELDVIDEGAAAFGEGLYMEGVCRPDVEAADGGDRTNTVLAKLGRRA